jgi:hypothetical protein
MTQPTHLAELEASLNLFSLVERSQALRDLITMAERGQIPTPAAQAVANMHCHSFYSFNAYGYSPAGLAWMARQRGIALLGIVDFDVLDGVDEFLDACLAAGVRGSAAMETRVFIPEFSSREINSPGEPGVYYYMGIGFTSNTPPSEAEPILLNLRARAEQRNRSMIERINAYLAPVRVDYERDVLPRTPSGNATERHMLAAYVAAVAAAFADPVQFWAEKLKLTPAQVAAQLVDGPTFQNTVRSKLMKRGGVGYAQPEAGSFPSVEEVNRLTVACGALPCVTWLDGTLAGEQAIEELMELLIGKGAVAMNIVPDRNWNISDPEVKRKKVQNLYDVVKLAHKLDIPLNIGTEMNAFGQKLVDDFDAPELEPVREAFLDGAYFIYGHTLMQRGLGLGYQSRWAVRCLPSRRERNEFYTRVGRLFPPTAEGQARLKRFSESNLPPDFLNGSNDR